MVYSSELTLPGKDSQAAKSVSLLSLVGTECLSISGVGGLYVVAAIRSGDCGHVLVLDVHWVRITKPYYWGVSEVMHGEYERSDG